MDDLIKRLESAGEGSRELSDEVLLACGWRREYPGLMPPDTRRWGEAEPNFNCPDPTRDLQDAIDHVVPEGWAWQVHSGGVARVYLRLSKLGESVMHIKHNLVFDTIVGAPSSAFPAIGMCIAALKARQEGCN